MNKKGFTVVELIVSFSLTIVITVFLVQIVLALNNLYNSSGVKTELLTKQSLISSQINDKLNEKTISSLTSCGSYCLKFNYNDGTNDILKVDYSNNIIEFGQFTTDLPEDSYFKDVKVDVVYGATIDNTKNNAILNIVIPIYSDKLDENFGVNIAYQFNETRSNISYVDFAGKGNYIVLNGATEQTFNTKTEYIEYGYVIYDESGKEIEGNVVVDNPLTTLPYKAGTYKIKYSLLDDDNNIISQTTRNINVVPSTYNITNLVTNGSFEDGNTLFTKASNSEMKSTDSYSRTGNNSFVLYPIDSTLNESVANSIEVYNFNSNHKYYFSSWYISEKGVELYVWNPDYAVNRVIFNSIYPSSTIWNKASLYFYNFNLESIDNLKLRLDNNNKGDYVEAKFDDILFIDLTEAFGAGNEPSQEWCDANINWFDGTIKINY